jgi:hypothetical protein
LVEILKEGNPLGYSGVVLIVSTSDKQKPLRRAEFTGSCNSKGIKPSVCKIKREDLFYTTKSSAQLQLKTKWRIPTSASHK